MVLVLPSSAPGESLYVPLYYWNSNTPYNVATSTYYDLTQGTSFSGPLTAGVICQWLGRMGIQNRVSYDGGKSVPAMAKEWLSRNIDWDYATSPTGLVGFEFGGGTVSQYPYNDLDEITLDGVNSFVGTGAASNVISITLGSEYARFNPTLGDKIQFRVPEAIPAVETSLLMCG